MGTGLLVVSGIAFPPSGFRHAITLAFNGNPADLAEREPTEQTRWPPPEYIMRLQRIRHQHITGEIARARR